MNIEKLIHEIISLNEKIGNDMDLCSYLDKKDFCGKAQNVIEERLSEEFELLDCLKTALADTVVKAYTGVDVSVEREQR